MNFERGRDPKESLGIGLMGESLTITGIEGSISIERRKNNGNTRRTRGILLKRWFIPMRFVLFLLKRSKISSRLIQIFFYFRDADCSPGGQRILESFGLGMKVRSNIRKIRRQKRYAKINFNSNGWRLDEIGDRDSSSTVTFSIKTSDMEKAAKLHEENKDLKGVIYRGRTYPLGENIKILTV